MLVLSRKVGEDIIIADDIQVTVVSIRGDKVGIGITAPKGVPVDRREIRELKITQPVAAKPPPSEYTLPSD